MFTQLRLCVCYLLSQPRVIEPKVSSTQRQMISKGKKSQPLRLPDSVAYELLLILETVNVETRTS